MRSFEGTCFISGLTSMIRENKLYPELGGFSGLPATL
jgi:hypothetical protein